MPETMKPKDIAAAWHSVTDTWFTRRNKMHDSRQWEVIHDWGVDVVSEKTMKVVGRFETLAAAKDKAATLEDEARGAAVLGAIGKAGGSSA